MAGINFLDQLRGKKRGTLEPAAPTATTGTARFKISLGSTPGEDAKLFMRFFIMGAVFFGAYYYFQQYTQQENQKVQTQLDDLNQSVAKETQKKNQMKGIGDEMKGYAAQVQELQNKIRAVTTNELNRSYLVKALDYVASEMPREVWFSEVSATREDKGSNQLGQASFTGFALNAQAVSEFIQKLELSVYFPSTNLEHMELVDMGPLSTANSVKIPPNSRQFKITAKLGE